MQAHNRPRARTNFGLAVVLVASAVLVPVCVGYQVNGSKSSQREEPAATSRPKTVKVRMQARPGGPAEVIEMPVSEAPVDLPSVPADKARLKDNDLVLGIVVDGQAMAYPVRYLALYEVVDSRVGQTPVAPTW